MSAFIATVTIINTKGKRILIEGAETAYQAFKQLKNEKSFLRGDFKIDYDFETRMNVYLDGRSIKVFIRLETFPEMIIRNALAPISRFIKPVISRR